MNIWKLIWMGLWQGFGVELSFAVLWVAWACVYHHIAPKFHPEHLLHKIHEYFTK